MLDNSRARWEHFIQTRDGETIAAQLRHDQELCKSKQFPSLLALHMPPPSSDLASSISLHLLPESPSVPRMIRNLHYSGIVDGIKAYLQQMSNVPTGNLGSEMRFTEAHTSNKPSTEQFATAARVLAYLLESEEAPDIHLEAPIKVLSNALKEKLETDTELYQDQEAFTEKKLRGRKPLGCYICKTRLIESHPGYPSLCKPCGRFNIAESNLSLPHHLNLNGKTALVTGGRVNLGYHTSIRLLRCGARVVVSTRYPRDAEVRYLAEKDSPKWCDKLKIIGADFRAAKDVFQLVAAVKDQLHLWVKLDKSDAEVKLDILINNAAQTLTDQIETEENAIRRENQLQLIVKSECLVRDTNDYEPRVRAGMKFHGLHGSLSSTYSPTITSTQDRKNSDCDTFAGTPPATQEIRMLSPSTPKSSWMQSLHEIPYEDIVSTYSVNTLVPLILIRELLPIMGSAQTRFVSSSEKKLSARAHIINVSSREGIFESAPSSSAKHGHHVHTNMSKAGLNMITETEAERCWKERKVAMNSVDPGYMSAAPEIAARWERGSNAECPIAWEDGAGRVLWPIAVSWGDCRPEDVVWGRFLKHFGAVEVSIGV